MGSVPDDDASVDPITLADVAGAIGVLGSTFTIEDVLAKLTRVDGREMSHDEREVVRQFVQRFIENGNLDWQTGSPYFVKKHGILRCITSFQRIHLGMTCRILASENAEPEYYQNNAEEAVITNVNGDGTFDITTLQQPQVTIINASPRRLLFDEVSRGR